MAWVKSYLSQGEALAMLDQEIAQGLQARREGAQFRAQGTYSNAPATYGGEVRRCSKCGRFVVARKTVAGLWDGEMSAEQDVCCRGATYAPVAGTQRYERAAHTSAARRPQQPGYQSEVATRQPASGWQRGEDVWESESRGRPTC